MNAWHSLEHYFATLYQLKTFKYRIDVNTMYGTASIITAMMMDAAHTSETLINFNVTTRSYMPEDSKLQSESMTGSLYHIYGKSTCTVSVICLKTNFKVNIQDVGCQQWTALMVQCLDHHWLNRQRQSSCNPSCLGPVYTANDSTQSQQQMKRYASVNPGLPTTQEH